MIHPYQKNPHCLIHFVGGYERKNSQAGTEIVLNKQETKDFYRNDPDAGKDLVCPREVGISMLRDMRQCDQIESVSTTLRELSDFRDSAVCTPSLWYPAHGVLRVETADTARRVEADINAWLHRNRAEFPVEMGYHACVSTGAYSTYGNIGDEQHPWRIAAERYPKGCSAEEFRALHIKDASGQPNWAASPVRLLIVVDLCRECISNNYAVREGLAQNCASVALSVQARGRCDRAVVRLDGNGAHMVPSIELDQPKVFVHEAFATQANMTAVYNSYKYMMEPDEFIGQMPSLASLMESDSPEDTVADEIKGLTHHDKVKVAEILGQDMEEDDIEWPEPTNSDPEAVITRGELTSRAVVAVEEVAARRIAEIAEGSDPVDVKEHRIEDIRESAEKLKERIEERGATRVLQREGRAEPAPERLLTPPKIGIYEKAEVLEKGKELLALLRVECPGQTSLIDTLDKVVSGQIKDGGAIETMAREAIQDARDRNCDHEIEITSEEERVREWRVKRRTLIDGVVNNLRPGGYDRNVCRPRFRDGYGRLANMETGHVYAVVQSKMNDVLDMCFGRRLNIANRVLPTEHELARFDFPDMVPALVRHVTAQMFAEYAPSLKRGMGL
jgi:hypothetical protein